MKIGKYTLHLIETGSFLLDGGSMFGVVPKSLWQKTNPGDNLNRITLAARSLLLTSPDRKILIDTGMGQNWDEKAVRIYGLDLNNGQTLEHSLAQADVRPEEITDVILTHLHFDHTGLCLTHHQGQHLPAFPRAIYHVQKRQFDWALNPSDKDRASYRKDLFLPLQDRAMLRLHEGEVRLDDEIELLTFEGHTFGQQLPLISDSVHTLFFCGDLIPTTAHLRIPAVMAYDLQPLVTVQEKKSILQRAAHQEWLLFFQHDPTIALASVEAGQNGFSMNKTSPFLHKG